MHASRIPTYRRKVKTSIPKSLNLVKAWKIIGDIIAEQIDSEYSPIPYCFDTNAYEIGHIFIQSASQVNCFRAVPFLKVLGPIRDFIVHAQSNSKWIDRDLHAIKSAGDEVNFKTIAQQGKNSITFTAYDYYFLSKGHDMPIERNVTINRSSHEELSQIKWFGIITDVVATAVFELQILKGEWARIIRIGDKPHTILFKYEICQIDERGTVQSITKKKIPCRWLPIDEKNHDALPINEFRSQSTAILSDEKSR